tara:strand:+ start:367 stop:588 length:222 start_codon:yes stop_codon:yes gene_type:complete
MIKYILFLIMVLFACNAADGNPYKREAVAQRRQRIMRNGNIDNFYAKSFNIEWFVVNNKAYMGIVFNRNRGVR